MLVVFMGLLDMVGPVGPPPTPSKAGSDDTLFNEMYSRGGGLFLPSKEQDIKGKKELLEREEEDVIYQVISFVICQS